MKFSIATASLQFLAILAIGAGGVRVAHGEQFYSPDGKRIATVEKGVVTVTGLPGSRTFSRINKLGVKFGPDGSRVAYIGVRDRKTYYVVDDREYGPFDDGISVEGFFFSPSGRHVAIKIPSGKQWTLWVDGTTGPLVDGIMAGPPVYSGDETKFGYAARRGKQWFVIADGREYSAGDGVLGEGVGFTASGTLYYASLSGDAWRVRVGDKVSEKFAGIANPGFWRSPDNESVMYKGMQETGEALCIDLSCGPAFQYIGTSVTVREGLFGRNFWRDVGIGSVVGLLGGVYVSGNPLNQQSLIYNSVLFSPDGKHHVYNAYNGEDNVVIDGSVVATIGARARLDSLRFGARSDVVVYKASGDERPRFAKVPGASTYVPPDPAAPQATLDVVSSEPDVLVYVDDRFAGFAPQKLIVPAGTRRVALEKHGHVGQEASLNFAPGSTESVTFEGALTPVRKAVQDVLGKYERGVVFTSLNEKTMTNDTWQSRLLAGMPFDEDILAVVNAGTGHTFVFGESGMFVRNAFSSRSHAPEQFYLSYEAFAKFDVLPEPAAFEVTSSPDKSAVVPGVSLARSRLIECLDELRHALAKLN